MLKYAKIDKKDEDALKMFRLAVKKRLFSISKVSLCPTERLDKIVKGEIKRPILIFENEEDEKEAENDEDEITEISLEQRKAMLEGLYLESVNWYKKLESKFISL